MHNLNFENISLHDLKYVLKKLKFYRTLKKQLGKRGKNIFYNKNNGKKNFLVEYFPSVGEDLAWQESSLVYKKIYGIDIDKKDVSFKEDSFLLGGIRVYLDDYLIDLSYNNFEKQLKQII